MKAKQIARHALAGLLNDCRKPPWLVRPADAWRWREEALAWNASCTRARAVRKAREFFHFASARSWTSPAGRPLRLCRANPLEALPTPKEVRGDPIHPLSETEVGRLLAAIDEDSIYGKRDRALILLILGTGLRLSPALALRWQDIALKVQGDPEDQGGAIDQKQGGTAPCLLLPMEAWKALQAHRERQEAEGGIAPGDFIFTPLGSESKCRRRQREDRVQKPMAMRTALKALRGYAAWAGLAQGRVTFETLRLCGARRAAERSGKAQAEAIAAFLGIQRDSAVRLLRTWKTELAGQPPAGELAPAGPLRRRPQGFQPGNQVPLKHGWKSPRFWLTRLGIFGGAANDTDPRLLPGQIAEVQALVSELFELPPMPLEAEIQKFSHIGYLVYSVGRLKARWIESGRGMAEPEGAEWEAQAEARPGMEPEEEQGWEIEDFPLKGFEPQDEDGWEAEELPRRPSIEPEDEEDWAAEDGPLGGIEF